MIRAMMLEVGLRSLLIFHPFDVLAIENPVWENEGGKIFVRNLEEIRKKNGGGPRK